MAEWLVGRESDFAMDTRVVVQLRNREVAVFRQNGRFYAIDNTCLHQGGPVGEGVLIGKVEAVVADDQRILREEFSETEMHIVCPWHGWEYDIATGACAGDRRRRLSTFETVVKDGSVYVRA